MTSEHRTEPNDRHSSGERRSANAPARPDPRRLEFVITGFGPFRNAAENPSMILANEIESYLQTQAHLDELHSSCAIRETLVLETSAAAVRDELRALQERLAAVDVDTDVCILHLGVNFRGKDFQVESCAYNDADFRIPDERGFQPKHQVIVECLPLGATLESSLNVDGLVENLNATAKGDKTDLPCPDAGKIVASTDPGRFVCNYTYCWSLNSFASDMASCRQCLFLHVPPFENCFQKRAAQSFSSNSQRALKAAYAELATKAIVGWYCWIANVT
jgi:pyroglutamyl-peptidase